MNVIDDVKKLLATTETKCVKGNAIKQGGCPRCAARETLRAVAIPIAQTLVESQEALVEEHNDIVAEIHKHNCYDEDRSICAAVRLDGLAKAMKQETPRS